MARARPEGAIPLVRELIGRILLRDAKVMERMSRGYFFHEDELNDFVKRPDSDFPLMVRGIEIKNKNTANLMRHALKPKNQWPAGLQASADRLQAFAKFDLSDPKKQVPSINVNNVYMAIPAPVRPVLDAADRVLRLERAESGELRPVEVNVDVEAVAK